MPLKDSLKVGPWPGGAPFLSEIEGEQAMPSNNTITTPSNPLTPSQLREALDLWCEEQPNTMWFDGIGMRWCINARLSNGIAVVKVAMPTSNDPLDSGSVFCLPAENPVLIDTFREYLLFLLTLVAIENNYAPWLELVANIQYTGAKAARMVLAGMNKPVSGGKDLAQSMEQEQQDLAGRIEIEGVRN
ncbi:hypothetical protein D0962_18825 [Leptolyngbyaceae cyanobacterium CCMR0082]|uniref:Uncharacterized protein n=1 Tax=Adonisia turfae CCMR0082 TaxID=2304604 RepID=A0A6M0S8L5_9CYAN|nr:hypothetical protein [Adonisia turfae]NEZ64815.1 hypothetical protein [Adonisia turfae CCMR0082]